MPRWRSGGRAGWLRRRGMGADICRLYAERVTQAHLGCDFDFLQSGEDVGEPEIH